MLDQLIAQIHDSGRPFVLAITGGGTRAIAELLERPGGSRVLLEAIVPYSSESLAQFLGTVPEQNCSARTARLMAMAAFQRALKYRPGDEDAQRVFGIGCTASLASDRPKLGEHRIHVAVQNVFRTSVYSVALSKGSRSRAEEEQIAAGLILNAIAASNGYDTNAKPIHGNGWDTRSAASSAPTQLPIALLDGEAIESAESNASPEWTDLMLGRRRQVIVGATLILPDGRRRAVFPGAFNPRHDAHRQMAKIAEQTLGLTVEWEISIQNVDKPPLDFIEMEDRAAQFAATETLWYTLAPTFEEKSRLFPNTTFIVGIDTLLRIADVRYYGDSEEEMFAAIARLCERGCRFLVFGRQHGRSLQTAGEFQTLSSIQLPTTLKQLCEDVPAERFRLDVSSSEIRKQP